MLEFLLALLTTATVGALLVPLLRSRVTSRSRFDGELAIYRDQLAEIARHFGFGKRKRHGLCRLASRRFICKLRRHGRQSGR